MINNMNNDFSYLSSKLQAQQSYTDLNSLQNIKQAGKEDKSIALRKVAQQFESMFIQMMLKSMRSANEVFGEDNPLNSFEMKHHQEMYDNQLSLSLSTSNNIGLADAFYRQMEKTYLAGAYLSDDKEAIGKHFQENNKSLENTIQPIIYKGNKVNQRIKDAGVLNSLKTPEDFIQAITPYAKAIAKDIGVDYRVLIAQSALETGWGEHIIRDQHGNQSFNLFNIKADNRWQGKSVSVPTIEYVDGIAQRENAKFRRYASINESFTDYQQFLSQSRYQKALSVSNDAALFVKELQVAGYATDPRYAEKIGRILQNEKLWSVE
jgi:peptidoglycan hydrolase FlgJ